ncbi:glycoside hydrolase family 97 protein [Novipirellula aureliae]|nr:glycoside hydrolase family 97 protein [Novipirellula aureliae]
MKSLKLLLILTTAAACSSATAEEILRSPDEKIEVSLRTDEGNVTYSVRLGGDAIIGPSSLGLKPNDLAPLEVAKVTRSSADNVWEPVWGSQKRYRDHYNEIQLKVEGDAAQTIIFRAYNDGIAFRYQIPESFKFSDQVYAHEASEISIISEKPTAWFPLSQVLVSDAVDLNTWESGNRKVNKNARYDFKPARIRTPFTVKLSEQACLSVHEAAVVHSDEAWLNLDGNTLTVLSNLKTAGGWVTPWRTIQIADKPGGLITSSLIVNLNAPCEFEDTSWIKPGVTLWDWRAHGAHADDGFEYGLNTESYIRFIDFAAEAEVEYLMLDAEWYGPERDPKSDPKTAIPEIDIEQVCAYAKSKGVGIWLYVNTKAFQNFDMDETFSVYRNWGVVGIKHGFLGGGSHAKNEFSHNVAKKCAEYHIMYVVHESEKPSGVERTWPNILSYEYVNSMLDSGTRPAATPSRVINNLFVFGLSGPVDRSCGMFDLDSYITREYCHRQIPSTVVSQTAQCLLFPSGLVTLPDFPDAYRRKADLFEFIAQLPMSYDETRVLDAEFGQHITLARQAGDEWFVGALADEAGRKTSVTLDFLEEGVTYDLTLYEDAPDAHYEYIGPMNKREAMTQKVTLEPQATRRELYQVKKITAKKGDMIPTVIAPGGGHCMWIRPQAATHLTR